MEGRGSDTLRTTQISSKPAVANDEDKLKYPTIKTIHKSEIAQTPTATAVKAGEVFVLIKYFYPGIYIRWYITYYISKLVNEHFISVTVETLCTIVIKSIPVRLSSDEIESIL